MSRSLRACLGIGLLATLLLIVVSGFFVGSSGDFTGLSVGFAWGLLAAYGVDAFKRRRARGHS